MTKYATTQILIAVGLAITFFLVIYIITLMFILSFVLASVYFILHILMIVFIENKDDIFTVSSKIGENIPKVQPIIKLKQPEDKLLGIKEETNSENS